MPPPRRDLDMTREQLCVWLRDKLPGARDVSINALRGPSATGFSSDTLMFDVQWVDGSGTHRESMVARFRPTGFTVFPTYDIAQQYHVMRILGGTDVPVPRMRWLEEDAAPLGAPFYVMDRVEGRVPTDNPPYHVGGWLPKLAAGERAALWWSGLDAMAAVHRLDWRRLGFDFLDSPVAPAGKRLAAQLHEYQAFIAWGMDRQRYPLLGRAERWLWDNQPADEPVALCWGDARLGNQIFDATRCVAVIDWEMTRLGDPVQDLAWWIALDRCFSEGLGAVRLPGLPDRDTTIARWESIVGRPAQYLEYYEVLALYKFAAIMARVLLQLKHYEVFPADSDMDSNNLASVTLAKELDRRGA